MLTGRASSALRPVASPAPAAGDAASGTSGRWLVGRSVEGGRASERARGVPESVSLGDIAYACRYRAGSDWRYDDDTDDTDDHKDDHNGALQRVTSGAQGGMQTSAPSESRPRERGGAGGSSADVASQPPPAASSPRQVGNDRERADAGAANPEDDDFSAAAAVRQRRNAVRAKQRREEEDRRRREKREEAERERRRMEAAEKRAAAEAVAAAMGGGGSGGDGGVSARRDGGSGDSGGARKRAAAAATTTIAAVRGESGGSGAAGASAAGGAAAKRHRHVLSSALGRLPVVPPFGTLERYEYIMARDDELLEAVDRELLVDSVRAERRRLARAIRARPVASRDAAKALSGEASLSISLALPLAPPADMEEYWFQVRQLEWRRLQRELEGEREHLYRRWCARIAHDQECRLVNEECDAARREVVKRYLSENAERQAQVEARLWQFRQKPPSNQTAVRLNTATRGRKARAAAAAVAAGGTTVANIGGGGGGGNDGGLGVLERNAAGAVTNADASNGGGVGGGVKSSSSSSPLENNGGEAAGAGAGGNGAEQSGVAANGDGATSSRLAESDRNKDGALLALPGSSPPGALAGNGGACIGSQGQWAHNGALAELVEARAASAGDAAAVRGANGGSGGLAAPDDWPTPIAESRPRVRIALEHGEVQRDLRAIVTAARAAERARVSADAQLHV